MHGFFDDKKNMFIIIIDKEKVEFSHKELEEFLSDKMEDVSLIYSLLCKHPQNIKD